MKLTLFLAITLVVLQTQGVFSYLYQKENRYSNILKKYSDISQPEVSGLNLKITDDSVNNLVDKLIAEIGDEDEDVDRSLFEFEDNDDFNGFEDVDLNSWGSEKNVKYTPYPIQQNTVVTSTVGKWGCVYSRIFSISSNKTKSFWKVHETSKQGGQISSDVQGSIDTKLTVTSSGKVSGSVNNTVYFEGKEYKTKIGVETSLKTTEVDTKVGKKEQRFISSSNATIKTNVQVQNKTIPIGITVSSKAETFTAPFRVYLTLFESDWELNFSADKKFSGQVRGEVTSRVVFSKNGKSLTKSWIKGYVTAEGDQICSVKMFKVGSHVFTKTATKEESSESNESSTYEDDNAVTIDVCTYSKGKVYERAEAKGNVTVFAGSGAVSYEKDVISVPTSLAQHEYGIHWMVKNLLNRKLASWGKPSTDILNV